MNDSEEQTPPDPTRIAGVLLPVFAIRMEDDLGIGDVRGVRMMVDWLAGLGMRFLQMLPINETGQDNSPYNAISSVALEPALLEVSPEGLPDLSVTEYDRVLSGVDVDSLRSGGVKYTQVKGLKLNLLWRAFEHFWAAHYGRDTDRDRGFHDFCASEQEWLGDYCLFRLLMDMEGGSENWDAWHEEYNDVEKARPFIDALLEVKLENTERQLAFYAYVQWVAFSQWRELRAYAEEKGVTLMGDIPFGVSYCSADVFCQPQLFDLEWSGGAPPEKAFKTDAFTEQWGQNWGIPLYRWDVAEETGYAWWRRRVGKVCEIFSLFRIDHALGFYRIYSFPWRPGRNDEFLPLSEDEARERTGGHLPGFKEFPDDSDEHAAANRDAGERYLRMIQEAAGSAEIIAEDLGVVPEYVPPSLADLGIAGMKVPQWEVSRPSLAELGISGLEVSPWETASSGQATSGLEYPYLSLTTYATHDHDPLKTQWNDWRGIARGDGEEGERETAGRNLDRLSSFAGIEWNTEDGAYNDTIREALLRGLFASASKYAAVMITDLLGLEDRFNNPGSVGDENWTSRMEESVKELVTEVHWTYLGARIRRLLEESNRTDDGGESDLNSTD
jgi:4-alpha-glucanotransferase